MTLTKELAALRQAAVSRIPEDTMATMTSATQALRKSGIVEKALKAGDPAPDFTLPNAQGKDISFANMRRRGPVIISFYRGGWCPYCNLELKALHSRLPEITQLGGQLIGISPELPDNTKDTIEKNGLGFDVLSDVGNKVARQFGLVFKLAPELRPIYEKFGVDLLKANGDSSYELPIPATYVIDDQGIVIKAFVDPDYTHRLDPDEVIAALKK